MKKILLIITLLLLSSYILLAHNDLLEKSGKEAIPYDNPNLHQIASIKESKLNYAVPEWEWVKTPYSIMTSWYDYMPSSYEGYPLRLQHNGDGGLYYTWHALQMMAQLQTEDSIGLISKLMMEALLIGVQFPPKISGKVTVLS